MREHDQAPPSAERSHADLRSSATPDADHPVAAPTTTVADRTGSVLDHLRRGRLAPAWRAVTDAPAEALPGRVDLERHFGTSLGHVRVHCGRAARSLLDHLGADGATFGDTVLLRDRTADRATVAHEVAHVLQAARPGEPTTVVAHDDEAEHEAEAVATGAGRPLGAVHRRLPAGAIALRRPQQRRTDAASADPARGIDELDRLLRPPDDDRRAPDGGRALELPEIEAPDATPPDVGADVAPPAAGDDTAGERDAAVDEQPGEGDEPAAMAERAAAEVATGTRPGDGDAGADVPDRRRELDADLRASQDRWDEGSGEAEQHEVRACPEHATAPGTQPFARGPPLEVPATSDAAAPEPVEPDAVPRAALERAERNVGDRLSDAPARAPPSRLADLDDDERDELRRAHQRLDRAVATSVARDTPRTIEDESLDLVGDADPARIDREHDEAAASLERQLSTADAGTEEDFGEAVMAPESDPTEDLDTGLDELDVPAVDVDGIVETSRLDLVATEANAGTVDIREVVLATDEDMSVVDRHAQVETTARRQIDTDIAAGDREVTQHCTRARVSREQTEERVRRGVSERRGRWSTAVDRHVGRRDRDADELVRTRRRHVERIGRESDSDASAVVEDARREASSQWSDTRERARNKAEEPNDDSWFSRGIQWLRDAISDLVSWIDDFIDACRAAIDAMLDAASAVAHAIIEAGHRAITATIDGLHAGLDLIVDNLPGELGELANEYRDDIHDFLDDRQADVDRWADDLHQGVDESIEGLREDLHGALDDFQDAVHEAAEFIDDILENGLMPWLRRTFPFLATLVDEGLLAPIRRASDLLGDWLDAALEATGIRSLQETLAGIDVETLCEPPTREQQAESCAAFEATLQGALEMVDSVLASPIAQRIQAFLQESRDETAAQQVDEVHGFFSFISAVARPVYEWWQRVEPTVNEVLDTLGSIASTIWRHIASALGIDPDLSPLEALRQGLEWLWEEVSQAVAPIVDGIRAAWDWIRNQSFLAPLFDFFAGLPELWDSLTALAGQIVDGAGAWLARAADVLANTILPAANRVAGAIADLVLLVVDQVEAWVTAIIGALDSIIDFQAVNVFVEALVALVAAAVTPIRTALVLFEGCAIRAWRWLANGLRDLGTFLRTLLDIAVGLQIAFLTFPIGLVAFFAGNVWLHLIADCYKSALIDFFLDLAIRFLRFLPEPADFMFAILHQGALNFLLGLRAAAASLKIGAVNLFASIFAGNAEIAAGFIVGLAEGVWESTGGTIIFLLQAVAWIMALPFKLAAWGVGMIRGTLAGESGRTRGGTAEARAPPGDAADPAISDDVEPTGRRTVRSRAPRAPRPGPPGADRDAEADGATTVRDDAEPQDADPVGARDIVDATDADLRAGEREHGGAEDEAGHDPAAVLGDRERTTDLAASGEIDVAVIDGADGRDPDSALDRDDPVASGPTEAEQRGIDPPAAPAGLSSLGDSLRRLVTDGFSRADVVALVDGARSMLRGMVARLAQDAAGALLQALNARGAGFAIGRTMGSIVGQIVVEVVLAAFTGGASAGITAAKVAITGARVTTRFASVVAKVKRAIEPLLAIVQRLRGALGDVLRSVRKWFDDVLGWMRGIVRRRRPPRPGRPPRRRPRGRRPDRRPDRRPADRGPPDRRGDRRRRRRDDRESPAERRRRRLRRAVMYMRPRLKARLLLGVSRRSLVRSLMTYQRMFRLTSLRMPLRPGRHRIVARINPDDDVTEVYTPSQRERMTIADEISELVLTDPRTVERRGEIFRRGAGDLAVPGGAPAAISHELNRSRVPGYRRAQRRRVSGETVSERRGTKGDRESRRRNTIVRIRDPAGSGQGLDYPEIAQALDRLAIDNPTLAGEMGRLLRGEGFSPSFRSAHPDVVPFLADTWYLTAVREGVRDPRTLVWTPVALDLVEHGRVAHFGELLGDASQIGLDNAGLRQLVLTGSGTGGAFPPSMRNFQQRSGELERVLAPGTGPISHRRDRAGAALERMQIVRRNEDLLERWARNDDTVTLNRTSLRAVIETFVRGVFRLPR